MDVMKYKTLKVDIEDNIAIVAFNRPESFNTLIPEMVTEIRQVFEDMEKEDEIKGVILTGAGDKAFMAGANVKVFLDMGPLEVREFAAFGQDNICNYIENYPKPVIAAVNGISIGGGTEISMSCDIRIASTRASFALPEVGFGIMPIFAATKRMQRLVGFGRAKELIMTGRKVKADEALQIGLVSKVVEPEDLIPAAKEMMQLIFKQAPASVYFSKLAINRTADADIKEAGEIERDLAAIVFSLEDKNEGIKAFLEKRTPEYKRG